MATDLSGRTVSGRPPDANFPCLSVLFRFIARLSGCERSVGNWHIPAIVGAIVRLPSRALSRFHRILAKRDGNARRGTASAGREPAECSVGRNAVVTILSICITSRPVDRQRLRCQIAEGDHPARKTVRLIFEGDMMAACWRYRFMLVSGPDFPRQWGKTASRVVPKARPPARALPSSTEGVR